jgi:hypothetical protein
MLIIIELRVELNLVEKFFNNAIKIRIDFKKLNIIPELNRLTIYFDPSDERFMDTRLNFLFSGRKNFTLITTFEAQEHDLQSIRATVVIALLSGLVKLLLDEKHFVTISMHPNYFQTLQWMKLGEVSLGKDSQ